MPDTLTVLAPEGVALAPEGVVLAVRSSYPTYEEEAQQASEGFSYSTANIPLA